MNITASTPNRTKKVGNQCWLFGEIPLPGVSSQRNQASYIEPSPGGDGGFLCPSWQSLFWLWPPASKPCWGMGTLAKSLLPNASPPAIFPSAQPGTHSVPSGL